MRLLIIGFSNSIHVVRWISQIADQGWDIHLFPSEDLGITHPDLKAVTVHHSVYSKGKDLGPGVRLCGIRLPHETLAALSRLTLNNRVPHYRLGQLKRLIRSLKPDIIHSMEMQSGAYLALEARKACRNSFPPWLVTNWGSDIYVFGRLPEHEPKIREVLTSCDYYSCECRRDVDLARSFGFEGRIMPVFPNAGGFDMDLVSRLRQPGPSSERRLIMLKGYQGWAGRALVGLRALERCADLLSGCRVAIYSASPEMEIAAKLFTRATGVETIIIPKGTPHNEMLSLHGESRVSIGLSIGDALSTSFLEAFVMGAFPIQSFTSGAGEWIEHGKTGMLVPPEDPEVVEQAVRIAMTGNRLVDQASEMNYLSAREKLDCRKIKSMAIEMYRSIMTGSTPAKDGQQASSRIES
jgi:hypothetical protein